MAPLDHQAALILVLRQRLATLVEAMPAVKAGDMRSVHRARVATRRLREALPVLRTAVHKRTLSRARHQVRRMTKALGPVREIDVSLKLLDDLARRGIVSDRALARVRDALVAERQARRREMLAAIAPGKVAKLRQQLLQVSTGPECEEPANTRATARRRVARRARRLVDAIDRAGSLYLAERLHAVRVAAKKLRYALEIARELERSRYAAHIAQLKRLQDLLGRMHDLEILIEWTRKVQADVAAADRGLAAELDALVRALERACRRDHAAYMRRRASIRRLCDSYMGAGFSQAVA